MKRILSCILIICMLSISAYCVSADSAPRISGIEFSATELISGDTVTATLSAEGFSPEDRAIFAMMLYEDGKMIDLDAMVHTFGEEENSKDFEAKITLPDDVEDCRLEAVLWDGIDTMNPLCTSAIFPGTETGLKSLSINGVPVEDFDPEITEYECTVDAYASSSPRVEAEKMDLSALVSVKSEKTFPGKSIVTVKANDESERVYTLTYKTEEDIDSLITNFDVPGCTLEDNLSEGSAVYGEEDYVDYVNLKSKLYGAYYIVPEDSSASVEGSFTLKRTAQVMVLSTGTLSLDESWTADASLSAQRFRAVDEENEGYGAYDELYTAYTKTVVVDGEPASVELSGLDSSCLVAVKFVYAEIFGEEIKTVEPRVTNIKYFGPTNDGTKVAENTQPQYGTDFKDGSLLYTNYALTCSDLLPEYSGSDFLIVQNPISSANPANTKSAWYGDTLTWITFEVRQNVTIRAFTNGKIDALTWAGGFTDETVADTVYLNRFNPQYPDAKTKHDRMYTKYVEASEENPVTVKIPNAAFTFASKWAYILTLDFEG